MPELGQGAFSLPHLLGSVIEAMRTSQNEFSRARVVQTHCLPPISSNSLSQPASETAASLRRRRPPSQALPVEGAGGTLEEGLPSSLLPGPGLESAHPGKPASREGRDTRDGFPEDRSAAPTAGSFLQLLQVAQPPSGEFNDTPMEGLPAAPQQAPRQVWWYLPSPGAVSG